MLTIFLGYLLVVLFSSDPPSSHTEPEHLAKYNNISECCMRDLGTSHCVRSPYVGPPIQSYTLTTAYKQIIMTSPSYILLSCFVPWFWNLVNFTLCFTTSWKMWKKNKYINMLTRFCKHHGFYMKYILMLWCKLIAALIVMRLVISLIMLGMIKGTCSKLGKVCLQLLIT